ncbi:MAG: hypothetical protein Q7R85_02145 [bacterium]|nr:hypothetical protein [bacterium]
MGPMTAWEYHDTLVASLHGRRDLSIQEFTGAIRYNGNDYPFTRVASRNITPKDRVMLIRATFHGDETAGAQTMLHHLPEIAEVVHSRGLKLIVYPLANPSGFERGEPGGENGTRGYDDWVRYLMNDGRVVDELLSGETYTRRFISSDPELSKHGVNDTLVQETALMHKLIRNDLALGARIVAALDLHQHCHVENGEDPEKLGRPAAYFYAFGERGWRKRYDTIVNRIERHVPVLRHTQILSGESIPMRTDDQGCIADCRDGSFTDYLAWRGTESITTETTGTTPPEAAEEVNMEWVRGLAKLHSRARNHTKT